MSEEITQKMDNEETLPNIGVLAEENDIIITLVNQIKERGDDVRITYSYADRDAILKSGSTKKYISTAADEAGYYIEREGENLIWLKKRNTLSKSKIINDESIRVSYELMKDILAQRVEVDKKNSEESGTVKERYFKLFEDCRALVCEGETADDIINR